MSRTDTKSTGTNVQKAETIEGEAPAVKRKTQALVRALEAKKEDLTRALGNRVDPEIFIQIVANAFLHDAYLMRCSQMSVYVAAMEAARTGLRPDGEEAVIVGYRDKDSGEVVAQFQPMYQGLVRLMLRAGARKVWAHVVYSADRFEYELGSDPRLIHVPAPLGEDRGGIVGAYAVVKLANGETQFEVMDLDELEKVRQASKVPNSPAYRGWLSEMYRKAPLRRLRKWVEMDADASAAFRLDAALEGGARGTRLGDFSPEHENRSIAEKAEASVGKKQDELRSRLAALTSPQDDEEGEETGEGLSEEDAAILAEATAKAEAALDALGDSAELGDRARLDEAIAAEDFEGLVEIEAEFRERVAKEAEKEDES